MNSTCMRLELSVTYIQLMFDAGNWFPFCQPLPIHKMSQTISFFSSQLDCRWQETIFITLHADAPSVNPWFQSWRSWRKIFPYHARSSFFFQSGHASICHTGWCYVMDWMRSVELNARLRLLGMVTSPRQLMRKFMDPIIMALIRIPCKCTRLRLGNHGDRHFRGTLVRVTGLSGKCLWKKRKLESSLNWIGNTTLYSSITCFTKQTNSIP